MWMSNSWQQAMEKQSYINSQDRRLDQEKLYNTQEKIYSNQEQSLYAEVGEGAFGLGRHNLSSFGGSYRNGSMMSDPAPYATTTLAMNNKMRTLDGKTFLALPQRDDHEFFTHKTNSSSGGDSVHSELMTPPSDSHFSPDKSKSSNGSGINKLSGGSGSTGGSYIPNWSDLFPPPPAYPPSDSESQANTPRVPRNTSNMAQMSPMGSQRNYSSQSPSLAKRVALQHLPAQDQDIAACHKNIWPNPMQTLPGQDISYLHSLQAQSFPHIPKTQLQLSESPTPQQTKMDIYENPSEHYASINNYGVGMHHPRTGGYGAVNHAGQDGSVSGPNFYGYGGDDYETSDYEHEAPVAGLRGRAGLQNRPSSSILGDRWADSSHSETEHDSDNNNRLVKR